MDTTIKISDNDNVIVALQDLKKDEFISKFNLKLLSNVSFGHKIACENICKGDYIYKYGHVIGTAVRDIGKGEIVHTNNIVTNLSNTLEYTYSPNLNNTTTTKSCTFNGFKRKNGKVGIRNEIWIIPTVGCVNSVAVAIANKASQNIKGSVQKVIAYTHPYGCSQMGEDQENTRKIIANLAVHPNAGGVLLLGLGCENCGIETIKPYLGDYDKSSLKFLIAQDVEDEIETALEIVDELIENASKNKRTACDVSDLVIGLKCGGSDGLSGITANPTVGKFSDILINHGGTSILTEVPEMFGAETILFNRCKDEETYAKAVNLINSFKNYFISHNQVVYENPSPGNKAGGISTLEDKSLGCTQKSGSCNVIDILDYGQKVNQKGLNLLWAPGNDLVASTALSASGAHIVLFTTGRGTPFASPVPTLKISSNSALNAKKSNWIDFNCGEMVDGTSLEVMGENLFNKVICVANG